MNGHRTDRMAWVAWMVFVLAWRLERARFAVRPINDDDEGDADGLETDAEGDEYDIESDELGFDEDLTNWDDPKDD